MNARQLRQRNAAKRGPAGAKHRLTDMTVSEISFVDLPANLRKFVTLKARGGLSLPSEARTAFSEAVMDALEKLSAVTQTIAESRVDDGATDGVGVLRAMVSEVIASLRRAETYGLDDDSDDSDDTNTEAETAKARGPGDSFTWPDDMSAYTMSKAGEVDPSLVIEDLAQHMQERMLHARENRVTSTALRFVGDDFADQVAKRVAKRAAEARRGR